MRIRHTYQSKVQWDARNVLRTPAFWLIAAATAISQGIVVTTLLATMGMAMATIQIPLSTIGFIIGTTGILSLVGNLVAGPIVDRINNRYVYGVALALMAIGMWLFSIMGPANVSFVPVLFVIIYGIGSGFTYVLVPTMLANYFGAKNFATYAAVVALVVAFITTAGPPLAGHVFDTTGSYSGAWMILMGALVVGIICVLLAFPPKPKDVSDSGAAS